MELVGGRVAESAFSNAGVRRSRPRWTTPDRRSQPWSTRTLIRCRIADTRRQHAVTAGGPGEVDRLSVLPSRPRTCGSHRRRGDRSLYYNVRSRCAPSPAWMRAPISIPWARFSTELATGGQAVRWPTARSPLCRPTSEGAANSSRSAAAAERNHFEGAEEDPSQRFIGGESAPLLESVRPAPEKRASRLGSSEPRSAAGDLLAAFETSPSAPARGGVMAAILK